MRERKRLLFTRPFLAAVLFLALAGAGCASKSDPTEHMPERLAGLDLTRLITGEQAMDSISELHGKTIDLDAGAIGHYGQGRPPITVWISRAPTPEGSKEQTVLMLDMMLAGRGPFENGQALEMDGVEVYVFDGMGQKHYVFYQGDLAYWIAASPDVAQQALTDFFQ